VGQIIRKDAAVEDILGDTAKSLENAKARGGRWKDLAEQRLAPVLTLFTNVEAQRKAAEQAHAPHAAAVTAQNEKADKTIGKTYDVVWNEVGRPAWDASLAVIFPDGMAYYADGDTDEQPERMEILVKLLTAGIHPRLTKATADTCAAEIAAEAQALRDVVDAGRKTAAQVKVLGRVRTALAKVVHAELSSLKRLYKAEGFSETEIHAVIPDRPTKPTKKDPSDA
jgi:NADPH:quinone reductase-like Zn-dependent oxidoreductase